MGRSRKGGYEATGKAEGMSPPPPGPGPGSPGKQERRDQDLLTLFRVKHPHAEPECRMAQNRISILCRGLAMALDGVLPDSPEKAIAVTHIREAMWAAMAALDEHGPRTK